MIYKKPHRFSVVMFGCEKISYNPLYGFSCIPQDHYRLMILQDLVRMSFLLDLDFLKQILRRFLNKKILRQDNRS